MPPPVTPSRPKPPPSTTDTRPTAPVETNRVAKPTSLEMQLPADWRKALAGEFKKPYWKELEKFLKEERANFNILPPPEQVFAALKRTPVSKVKAVLLGQDPYPTKGNANGLSFSVEKGMPVPASLRNIYKGLAEDLKVPIPTHGDLGAWADQGVLLLNTVLTVREGLANSHKQQGWELFTQAVMEVVNRKHNRVAFMFLGKQAQEFGNLVNTERHTIVNAPHPSPLVPGNPFAKAKVFSQVNAALKEAGRTEIDWTIK